jgi:hypothetical protein
MKVKDFRNYLHNFEGQVIIKGVEDGIFGKQMMVSARRGKLDSTKFGQLLGSQFEYTESVVIDYYGLIKKSVGFINKINSFEEIEAKAALALIVHFAAIKDEHIVKFAPELMIGFPEFKKFLIQVRSF